MPRPALPSTAAAVPLSLISALVVRPQQGCTFLLIDSVSKVDQMVVNNWKCKCWRSKIRVLAVGSAILRSKPVPSFERVEPLLAQDLPEAWRDVSLML